VQPSEMRCPTLVELPRPPAGKNGWPWIVETPPLASVRPDGTPWPRVTIVTPSFNQGQFVEQTIRSVLLQGYPNLEYIVMDGGSSDESVQILNRYAKWFSHFESKPDGGQVKAINAGFSMATGEILAWVNSDDGYLPNVLGTVAALVQGRNDSTFLYGNSLSLMENGSVQHVVSPRVHPAYSVFYGTAYPQHSCFWTADIHLPIWDELVCAIDYELWLRMLPHARHIKWVNKALAFASQHSKQKTSKSQFDQWGRHWERDLALVKDRHKAAFKRLSRPSAKWIRARYRVDLLAHRIGNAVTYSSVYFAALFPEREISNVSALRNLFRRRTI